LTHPKYRVPRSYIALVHGLDTAELERKANERVTVDHRVVQPSRVRVRAGKEGRSVLEVTLSEGRNRIVRRWVEAMGGKVDRLARVAYGPVRLGDLAPGEWRPLTPQEERGIYRAIGMTPEED
jgi:23S rRNA pseudouridine2605 synthase